MSINADHDWLSLILLFIISHSTTNYWKTLNLKKREIVEIYKVICLNIYTRIKPQYYWYSILNYDWINQYNQTCVYYSIKRKLLDFHSFYCDIIAGFIWCLVTRVIDMWIKKISVRIMRKQWMFTFFHQKLTKTWSQLKNGAENYTLFDKFENCALDPKTCLGIFTWPPKKMVVG